jgi:hypothetical protein
MTKSAAKYSLYLLLLLTFSYGLVSAFHFKQLFNDGAYWALDIANLSTWHIERQYFRYTTLLLQTPAVLAAKFTHSLGMIPLLFSLGYFLYPFLTLSALLFFFRKNSKFDFFYIIVLTFFLVIIPNWAFSVSVVNESIVIGWCLSSYIIFLEKPRAWIIVALGVMLLFSYEMGIAFYGLAFYLLWREKKLKWKHVLIFTILGFLQFYNLLKFILPYNHHLFFKSSFPDALQTTFFRLTLSSLVIFTFGILTNPKIKFILLIFALIVSSFASYSVLNLTSEDLAWQSYHNRTWAIPVAVVFLLLGYETLRNLRFSIPCYYLFVISLLSIPSVIMEFKLNKSHISFNQRLNKEIELNSKCKILSPDEWNSLRQGQAISTWSFPHLSLLYNKELNIQTMLFTLIYDGQGTILPNDSCHLKDGAVLVKDPYNVYKIYPLRINLNKIYN